MRTFVVTQPVDGRKGADSLMTIVRDLLAHDPLSGHFYVFFTRRSDGVRIVYWDRNGIAMWLKRLERGRFHPAFSDDGRLTASAVESAFGTASTGVHVVTNDGAVGTWDGVEWGFVDPAQPERLTRSAGQAPDGTIWAMDDDAWAVGTEGCVVHWDGERWSTVPIGSDDDLHAIVARAADDLWVAAGPAVLHSDGDTWTRIPVGLEHVRLLDVWAPPQGDVWAIGLRDNDTNNEAIGSVVVRGGDAGWSLVHESDEHMRAIWGRGETDVWIAGQRTLRHFDGEAFREVATFGGDPNLGAFTFFSSNDDDAWLVGFYGLLWHFDGASWRDVSLGTSASVWGGFANAPDDAWIVGEGNLLAHWDGAVWTQFAGPRGSFHSVGGAGDAMWIVGYDGFIAVQDR